MNEDRTHPCHHPGCPKPGMFGENDFLAPRGAGPVYWCADHHPAAPEPAAETTAPAGPPRAQERLL